MKYLSAKFDGKITLLNNVEFDTSTCSCTLSNKVNSDIHITINCPLNLKDDVSPNDYNAYVFKHWHIAENNIFQVYESDLDARIGWIFPIQALESTLHSYPENEHFLRYAYIAFIKLVQNEANAPFEHVECFSEQTISLEDIYGKNAVVLVLCNSKTSLIENYSHINYIPHLYSFGYNLLSDNNASKEPTIYTNTLEDIDVRLNVKPIAKELFDEKYINILFSELLRFENHHLVKFHLLYQIIEILIEKVFEKEMVSLMNTVSDKTISLYQAKDDMRQLLNEKKRINILFSDYVSLHDKESELESLCNEFLALTDTETKDNLPDALYSVRNLVVHKYREVSTQGEDCLKRINSAFEEYLVDILISYSP